MTVEGLSEGREKDIAIGEARSVTKQKEMEAIITELRRKLGNTE